MTNPWKTNNSLQVLGTEPLGAGSFGSVWKAQHVEDENVYAVKQINVAKALKHFSTFEKIKREVENHGKVQSTFVLRYYTFWFESGGKKVLDPPSSLQTQRTEFDSSTASSSTASSSGWDDLDDDNSHDTLNLFIHMEFCNYKPLTEFLLENETFEKRSKDLPRILDHLSRGLEAIHAQNIIHRDLKPANVICAKSAYTGKTHYKIADFGLSVVNQGYGEDESIFVDDLLGESMQDLNLRENPSIKGTLTYRSPEMLEGVQEGYTEKTDIFSLGLIFLELICPQLLNRAVKIRLFTNLQTGTIRSQDIPAEYFIFCGSLLHNQIQVVKRMLERSAGTRPSATEICTLTQQPVHFSKIQEPQSPNNFTGREKALEKISSIFSYSFKVVVTSEFPGMGKTALVSHFVKEYLKNQPNINLVWINTRTTASSSLTAEIEELALELDVATRVTSPVPVVRESAHIFNDICRKMMETYDPIFETIFIIDSVADEDWILRITHTNKVPAIYIIDSEYFAKAAEDTIVNIGPFLEEESKRCLSLACVGRQEYLDFSAICRVTENHPAAISKISKILKFLQENLQEDEKSEWIGKIADDFIRTLAQIKQHEESFEWSDFEYLHAASMALAIHYLIQNSRLHPSGITTTAITILQILKCVDNTGTSLNTVQKLCHGIIPNLKQDDLDAALQLLRHLDLVVLPEDFVEAAKSIFQSVLRIDRILPDFSQVETSNGMKILQGLANSTRTAIMDSQFFWLMTPNKSKQVVEEFADFVVSLCQRTNNTSLHELSKILPKNLENMINELWSWSIRS
ncbi:uncharacterized protein LOC118437412 [Folsomia candida]|uniref:uncharacterized protein LOC118437412 n=1 Tax=Folsomia candida TaxID=158441 RepID=UPI0016050A65|nr:uncharacterized protein LOC118437412 [Folsomia candida]